jgi:hypothetical protein
MRKTVWTFSESKRELYFSPNISICNFFLLSKHENLQKPHRAALGAEAVQLERIYSVSCAAAVNISICSSLPTSMLRATFAKNLPCCAWHAVTITWQLLCTQPFDSKKKKKCGNQRLDLQNDIGAFRNTIRSFLQYSSFLFTNHLVLPLGQGTTKATQCRRTRASVFYAPPLFF